MNYRWVLVFLVSFYFGNAQDLQLRGDRPDSTSVRNKIDKRKKRKEAKEKLTIKDYKIISYRNDTTFFDTTLTIQKEYNHNYLRRDAFELLPFSNVGQSHNKLGYTLKNNSLFPLLGARAKHFNYWEVEDVFYYNVPTPTTELFFKTVLEQGQVLDALFTTNFSKRFNFSIAYKGLRSLGEYQHILSSVGNFRFTSNYTSENGRYGIKLHITGQDSDNEENGGLAIVEQFTSEEPEFNDRARIDVVFEDAENMLVGKRYYFDHYYKIRPKDSISSSQLSIDHQFNYETKFYRFEQNTANDFFGASFLSNNIVDRGQLRALFNQVNVNYSNNFLGTIQGKAIAYNYSYFFKSVLIKDDGQIIPASLEGDEIAIGAQWVKNFNKLSLNADFTTNLSGDLGGTTINASAIYDLGKGDYFKAHAYTSSRMPNFNFLLYQSAYEQYNWTNIGVFTEEERSGIGIDLNLHKWVHLEADYSIIDNYTYFGESPLSPEDENPQIAPFQSPETINYLKVKLSNEFKFGKFALRNTLMYQNVDQEENIFNVPEFVTRNTLYFSDHLFKKALYLQTGFTFKYFTNYFADGYNPLISEFFSQDNEEFGGFPLIDFFINVKVRRTRIYLKAEHFNSPFTGNDFFSAPDYPYRDFLVRFGLVWNFFS